MGELETEKKDSREPSERLQHGDVGQIRNGEEEAMQTTFGLLFPEFADRKGLSIRKPV